MSNWDWSWLRWNGWDDFSFDFFVREIATIALSLLFAAVFVSCIAASMILFGLVFP